MTKETALDWYFDKIKSHFEHDGDLFEAACFTFAIAQQKEKEQIIDAYDAGLFDGTMDDVNDRMHKQYYNETYGKSNS